MKETKLLGSLFPSHPDAIPIIKKIREKYHLPEISPDDDPITEIYLDDEIIPLEVFRQDIENMVQESDFFITPESKFYKIYKNAKLYKDKPPKLEGWARLIPKDAKEKLLELYQAVMKMSDFLVQMIDQQHTAIANMFYIYLLTGESEEAPNDWFSKVASVDIDGETVIMAMASQVADPDVIVQQFREQYKKSFGVYRPKVTKTVVSTAYFMRLQRMNKKWDYIVEEFIRLNNLSLPNDKNSERYAKTWKTYSQTLRKRMQRSEVILKVLLEDKNK